MNNRDLFSASKNVIPGGVNSPVRAFGSVGGTPPVIRRAKGSRVWDEEGREFIDYVGSWGPMILGHAHGQVIAAVHEAIESGLSFGAPTRAELQLAELVVSRHPSIEMIRLVNSGTEATFSALRLARAFTRREKVIKFEGCYHGHADPFLVKAGSGATTLGVPNSPGVPEAVTAATCLAPFNDLESVQALFDAHDDGIAAVIVEPVAGNMGLIPPVDGFLAGLRELCTQNGAVLIFDEVMTGFRLGFGGAQELYNVTPDLTTLGKIIGGGLPIGAYGGRKEIMSMVAPSGPVYQAGTLSGNPVAVAAGLATLEALTPDAYARLEQSADRLEAGLTSAAQEHGCTLQRVGSMFCLYFSPEPVINYDHATSCDVTRFNRCFKVMLEEGIYIAPSAFEAGFVSTAHSNEDIEVTVEAWKRALAATA